MKGVSAIKQNESIPLFAQLLGNDWQKLPTLMQKRFSNRPYTNDMVLLKGAMTIRSSRWMRLIKPFLKITGSLIQQDGDNIPVTVKLTSKPNSGKYHFYREFKFNKPVYFNSAMVSIKNNIVVEFMRFNIGWRSKVSMKDDKVLMSHYGYVFRCFNILIPLPIGLLLGKCNVIEREISPDTFSMEMNLTHFYFGKIYEYRGNFTIAEVTHE